MPKKSKITSSNKNKLKRKKSSLGGEIDRLYDIIRLLRKKCPWDKKQTARSLSPLLIEEVYELAEAIEMKKHLGIKNELGDILLHVVFQSLILEEKGISDFKGVVTSICKKLITRHDHVFGNKKLRTSKEVVKAWEKTKKQTEKRLSILDGTPKSSPALLYAHRIQKKASSVGMDWDHLNEVREKLNEELNELDKARSKKEQLEEFGDVLFTMVSYSRFLNIEPEEALRKATEKFTKRFKLVEKKMSKEKKDWSNYNNKDLNVLWEKAKKNK